MKIFLAIAIGATLLISSCQRQSEGPTITPRRYAYARTAELDSAMSTYDAGGVRLSMSRSAMVSSEREGWLTGRYPAIGAVLYLSTTVPATAQGLGEAVANRRERISLNLGGKEARTDVLTTDGGFECEIVVCGESVSTPVQFFATDGRRLVSGAFVLTGSIAPADSLRPIVATLENEAFEIVNSLCGK